MANNNNNNNDKQKGEEKKVVRMEDIPSSSGLPTAVVEPPPPPMQNNNLPLPPAHYQLARMAAIESEPKTLFHGELNVARDAAIEILNTHTREEAMQIFLTGLQPAGETEPVPSENAADAVAPTTSAEYDVYCYESDTDYDFDDEEDEDLTEDINEVEEAEDQQVG